MQIKKERKMERNRSKPDQFSKGKSGVSILLSLCSGNISFTTHLQGILSRVTLLSISEIAVSAILCEHTVYADKKKERES
jgi:hypothetical protein